MMSPPTFMPSSIVKMERMFHPAILFLPYTVAMIIYGWPHPMELIR